MNIADLTSPLSRTPPWLIWTIAALGILIIQRMIVAGRPARSWASGAYYRWVIRQNPNPELLIYNGPHRPPRR